MRRRRIMVGLLLSLATPSAAEAQQTGKVWRIGFLGVANAAAFERPIEALSDEVTAKRLESGRGRSHREPNRVA